MAVIQCEGCDRVVDLDYACEGTFEEEEPFDYYCEQCSEKREETNEKTTEEDRNG